MDTNTLAKILTDWKLEKITPEQEIEYIIQNMICLGREITDLN